MSRLGRRFCALAAEDWRRHASAIRSNPPLGATTQDALEHADRCERRAAYLDQGVDYKDLERG